MIPQIVCLYIYIYIYIYIYTHTHTNICKYANMKNKVFRGWFYLQFNYLLTLNVLVFYIKPSSEQCLYVMYLLNYIIISKKWNEKQIEKSKNPITVSLLFFV